MRDKLFIMADTDTLEHECPARSGAKVALAVGTEKCPMCGQTV